MLLYGCSLRVCLTYLIMLFFRVEILFKILNMQSYVLNTQKAEKVNQLDTEVVLLRSYFERPTDLFPTPCQIVFSMQPPNAHACLTPVAVSKNDVWKFAASSYSVCNCIVKPLRGGGAGESLRPAAPRFA